ncbi:MAG: tetratricopeptide repeat protein [Planctomycetes bacterium]|nr:tetratricopeptide repeat protein [Planctomycetota bacterium]MDO8094860.1 tetratricopeptide repeat protein [Candidatus Brocadiales bacterium]
MEIIEHWIPPEVYELPGEFGVQKYYEMYKEPKSVKQLLEEAEKGYKKGNQLSREGKKEEAERKFYESEEKLQNVTKMEPEIPITYYWLAQIKLALSNTPEAEMYFTQYMNRAPREIKPYFELAEFYFYYLRKPEEARKALIKALKNVEFKEPMHEYYIYNNLGVIYYYLQNYTQAEFHFRKALKSIDMAHPDPYLRTSYELAETCTLHGDITKDSVIYEDALDVISKIEPLTKNNDLLFKICALKGYLNGKLKNYDNAEKDLQRALALNGLDITTKRNLKRVQKFKDERTQIEQRRCIPNGLRICIVGLPLVFSIILVIIFFYILPRKYKMTIDARTMYKVITRSFAFTVIGIVIGIFMAYMLPYITSIKYGEIEVNLQNPVSSEPILERPFKQAIDGY